MIVLTDREIEIVKLLGAAYTNDKIAAELHISYRTVETHRKNIMQKLGLKTPSALIKLIIEKNL